MPAPKQNQFWKLRSKHGRDKLFTTPELLWEAACEYFQWCEANPLIEVDFRGKDAKKVQLPKMRSFTLHQLCIYLDVSTSYLRDFKAGLKDTDLDKDFSSVITRIEEVIYSQKFVGAAAGFLNPNIIARDLGLRENMNVTAPPGVVAPIISVYNNAPPLADSEDKVDKK